MSLLLSPSFFSFFVSYYFLLSLWHTNVDAQRARFYFEELLIIIKQTFTPKDSGSHAPRSSQVTVQLTYLSQRHHYVLSFTHTRTIAELISKQTLRTLWTCLTWTVSRFLSVPSHIYPPRTRADRRVWARGEARSQALSLSIKAICPSHGLFKRAKVQLKGKNFDFQWRSCGWAASSCSSAPCPLSDSTPPKLLLTAQSRIEEQHVHSLRRPLIVEMDSGALCYYVLHAFAKIFSAAFP